MSDMSPGNQGALQHKSTPMPARKPKPGEQVWRLRDSTGRVQSCELRNNSRAGAGWEVQILEGAEILVGRRCADEPEARFVAEAAKKDLLRTGGAGSADGDELKGKRQRLTPC